MTTTLTNEQILTLFRQNLLGELTNQPLYYKASKKTRDIRRMVREQMEDINDTRETYYEAHAKGEMKETMEGETFEPETETVIGPNGDEVQRVVFESDEDEEKFQEKWDDLLDEEVEGFPVINERSLMKVQDDIRISGTVLDIFFEFGLIQTPEQIEEAENEEE